MNDVTARHIESAIRVAHQKLKTDALTALWITPRAHVYLLTDLDAYPKRRAALVGTYSRDHEVARVIEDALYAYGEL